MAITLNYETLFEFLRNEKKKDELQALDEDFYVNLVSYLTEKKMLLQQQQNKADLFSIAEKNKNEKQLINILQIVKELYERREKKILNMAINKVRTDSGLIDTTALLKQELQFFQDSVKLLSRYKNGILNKVMSCSAPNVEQEEQKHFDNSQANNAVVEPPAEGAATVAETGSEAASTAVQEPEDDKMEKVVRFVSPVPKFYGENLEVYGPFEEDDVATLPARLANIVITKNRAEEIRDRLDA